MNYYLTFRKGETLSHFLSWSHYMLILKKADGLEIDFYCKECEAAQWTVRELRRRGEWNWRRQVCRTGRTGRTNAAFICLDVADTNAAFICLDMAAMNAAAIAAKTN